MRSAAVFSLLTLCACRTPPDFAVPEQSPTFENFHPTTPRLFDFSQPGAPHIVRDILGDATVPWRWTLQRPAIQIHIGAETSYTYLADLTIPEITFKDIGPVTVTFTVNDHPLDRVRYATPGAKHFEKSIPEAWLTPHSDAIVGAEIDKMWTSKTDGARLGIILSRLGLEPR